MTKGRSYINSYADGIMRENMIEEVGTLLNLMMNEDMMTPKEIHMEFGVDPKTIAALRKEKTSVTFESIRKVCYVIGYYLMNEEAARERKIRWGRDKEQKKKDEISVDAKCCAGVTPESHRTALNAMKACQISVED